MASFRLGDFVVDSSNHQGIIESDLGDDGAFEVRISLPDGTQALDRLIPASLRHSWLVTDAKYAQHVLLRRGMGMFERAVDPVVKDRLRAKHRAEWLDDARKSVGAELKDRVQEIEVWDTYTTSKIICGRIGSIGLGFSDADLRLLASEATMVNVMRCEGAHAGGLDVHQSLGAIRAFSNVMTRLGVQLKDGAAVLSSASVITASPVTTATVSSPPAPVVDSAAWAALINEAQATAKGGGVRIVSSSELQVHFFLLSASSVAISETFTAPLQLL